MTIVCSRLSETIFFFQVQNNVCYKSVGHGYFLEDGSEQRNVFDGNLGLGTDKPPSGLGIIPTDKYVN